MPVFTPSVLTSLRAAHDALTRSIATYDAAVAKHTGLPASQVPTIGNDDIAVVAGYAAASKQHLDAAIAELQNGSGI